MPRLISIVSLAALTAISALGADHLKFPVVARAPVVDRHFDIEVRDDFAWLEHDGDPAVRKFTNEQNRRTQRWFDRATIRATIRQQLAAWAAQSSDAPARLADTPAGLLALGAVITRIPSLDQPAAAEVIFDPRRSDPAGDFALVDCQPSPSGRLIAVCLAGAGTSRVRFVETATGTVLPDVLSRGVAPVGPGTIAWNRDESGVFYARALEPDADAAARLAVNVCFHRLGTDAARDVIELGGWPAGAAVNLRSTPDGAYTLARVASGRGVGAAFHLRTDGGTWQGIIRREDDVVRAVPGDDGMLYLLSRHDAPRGQILRTPLDGPDLDSASRVVAPSDGAIRDFAVHDGRLYVSEFLDGAARLQQYSTTGASTRLVTLPESCAITALEPRGDGTLLLRLERHVEPARWYEFNPKRTTMRPTALAGKSPVDLADLRVERLYAPAGDGGPVAITVLTPASVAAGAAAPLMVFATRGDDDRAGPEFLGHRRWWFDAGGAIAMVHLRSARPAEMGAELIAGVRHLLAVGRAQSARLAITGIGDGGELSGAVAMCHPELFRALVGVDGRYDLVRGGREGEAGGCSPDTREEFAALLERSPFHQVVPGRSYPAVLLLASADDERAPVVHALKFAARLQLATTSRHPVLVRTTEHSAGAAIDRQADLYAFLATQLAMTAQK